MLVRLVPVLAVLVGLAFSSPAAAGQSTPMILALGNTGFLNPAAIQAATGAEVKQDLEKSELKDFSVIVLANISYPSLPGPVQQGLVEYVNGGGAVLITGGQGSFGSGGYQAVASILPFQIRSTSDWWTTSFRAPVPVQPGHPALAGVNFPPVGTLNDLTPRADATEILQSAGGGRAGPTRPLIAEATIGAGRVLGIALDLNEFGGMRDRDLFVRNTIAYLFSASRMGQGR